jgi:hypothetical protein
LAIELVKIDRHVGRQSLDDCDKRFSMGLPGCCESEVHIVVWIAGCRVARRLNSISPIPVRIRVPPSIIVAGIFSSPNAKPTITAMMGVTRDIIIAFVDSILPSNQ